MNIYAWTMDWFFVVLAREIGLYIYWYIGMLALTFVVSELLIPSSKCTLPLSKCQQKCTIQRLNAGWYVSQRLWRYRSPIMVILTEQLVNPPAQLVPAVPACFLHRHRGTLTLPYTWTIPLTTDVITAPAAEISRSEELPERKSNTYRLPQTHLRLDVCERWSFLAHALPLL